MSHATRIGMTGNFVCMTLMIILFHEISPTLENEAEYFNQIYTRG